MFDKTHILYMIISALVSAGVLTLLSLTLKEEIKRVIALRFFAIITVVIHFSSLWVNFFSGKEAVLEQSMLLPIHPCNVMMWLLLICSFVKKKEGIVYKLLVDFTFWGGVICGSIGIILNINYAANPDLTNYFVLKGLLSHSTMVAGAIYLLVGGFMKIRVSNLFGAVAGLCLFVIDGAIINTLYAIFKLPPCNSMYLLEIPFPDMPWLTPYVMALLALTLCFGVCALYEQLALPRDERWYKKLSDYISNKKAK